MAVGNAHLPQTSEFTTYLPVIQKADTFAQVPAIWVHSDIPADHEVALFKHTFSLAETLTNPEIQIFADTRYELYLDGIKLGRGPARFTRTYREYDRYWPDSLLPGEHTLTVLVQWAPNMRRSESISPGLQLQLIQPGKNGTSTLIVTGSHWLSQLSLAWQPQAADIAPFNLIGPSELLDLRKLSSTWFLFDGAGDWQPAVTRSMSHGVTDIHPELQPTILDNTQKDQPEYIQLFPAPASSTTQAIQYQPRSIPMPIEAPVAATVLAAGQVHPGFLTGEILASQAAPFNLNFQASQAASFTIEVLGSEDPAEDFIQVDQGNLSWNAAGDERPDVFSSQVWLEAGEHSLSFNQIPADGLTFAVSVNPFIYNSFPFEQGLHAGRRNLLANLVPDPNTVEITSSNQGLSVQFKQLPAYLVLDLGRTVHGRLSAEVSGTPGAVLDIGWDERLDQYQRPLPYPGSLFPGWNQVDSWILDSSARQITTLDSRAGRYILITAWGEAPIRLDSLQIHEERAPLSQTGSFISSDPRLNRIWQVGVDSLLPNMTDAITDTPWRERGQWWGDAFVANQVAQVSLGETGLLHRGLILMAQAMQTAPAPAMSPHNDGMHLLDYSMLWVHSLAAYIERNADSGLLNQLYPTLFQFMTYLESLEAPTTHLIDMPQLHWSQTAYIDPRCAECRYGQSTPINALYYSTLQQAAGLALANGDSLSAQSWQEKAQLVKNSVNEQLYLLDEQRYATSLYEGKWLAPGPHAQAWALAYDLVEEENIPAVTSALLELLSQDPYNPNLEIYGMYWVLKGLGKNGYIQPALEIIEGYYGHLLDHQASTWWENFNADTRRYNSLSHAWGGAPTWFLSTYLAGFEQTGPYSIRLQPSLFALTSLNTQIPLGNRSVEISWWTGDCHRTYLQINLPEGFQGELLLPATTSLVKFSLDGVTILKPGTLDGNDSHRGGQYTLNLKPGSHQVILEHLCSENIDAPDQFQWLPTSSAR